MSQYLARILVVSCLISQNSWAKAGFHSLGDAIVPEAVRESAKSVLRVRFPMVMALKPSGESGRELLEVLTEGLADLDNVQREFLEPQIDGCRKMPDEPCTIYDRGSAFPVGRDDILWTALHNVDTYIVTALHAMGLEVEDGVDDEEMVKLKELKMPVQIMNYTGAMIFGHEGDYAQVEYIDPIFKRGIGIGGSPNFMDYVRLKLSRPLGVKALEFSRTPMKTGEPVYLAGYPRKTDDRHTVGQPDADGKSLRIAVGKVLDIREAHRRWGLNFDTLGFLIMRVSQQSQIHSDTDSVSGNSGGPLLDSAGRVVGLHNSSSPKDSPKVSNKRSSLSIRPTYMLDHTDIVFVK